MRTNKSNPQPCKKHKWATTFSSLTNTHAHTRMHTCPHPFSWTTLSLLALLSIVMPLMQRLVVHFWQGPGVLSLLGMLLGKQICHSRLLFYWFIFNGMPCACHSSVGPRRWQLSGLSHRVFTRPTSLPARTSLSAARCCSSIKHWKPKPVREGSGVPTPGSDQAKGPPPPQGSKLTAVGCTSQTKCSECTEDYWAMAAALTCPPPPQPKKTWH